MTFNRFTRDERAAIGLPIRMVVLTTVGLVGFAAILAALTSFPVTSGPIYAVPDINSFSLPDGNGNSPLITITIIDNKGDPVCGANVVIRGPSGLTAAAGVTDIQGRVRLELMDIQMQDGRSEGYISIKATASGYLDLSETYFIKVTREF